MQTGSGYPDAILRRIATKTFSFIRASVIIPLSGSALFYSGLGQALFSGHSRFT